MALIINNVTSASQSIRYNYLAEDRAFGFTKEGSYEINVSDIQFDENTVLLSGIEAIKLAYENRFIAANIAGHKYTRGRITSLSFSESNLAGSIVASVVIEESESMGSGSFPNNILRPEHIESFGESYSFNRSGDSYSYSRDLNIKYKESSGAIDYLIETKTFLLDYFQTRPQYGNQIDGISEDARFNQGFYGNLNEQVDLINLSLSLNESFDSGDIDLNNNVSIKKTYTLSVDEGGYETKVINLNLYSLNLNTNTTLKGAVKNIISEIITEEGSDPKSVTKGFTVDGRQANITLSFSENPNDAGGDNISFDCSKSENNGKVTYSLNISYSSSNGDSNTEKFQNSIILWKSKNHSLDGSFVVKLFPEAPSIYETNRSSKFDYQNLIVSETIAFSEEDLYKEIDVGIVKYELSGTSNNLKKLNNEHRHNINFDLAKKEDFYESNKKSKLTTVSVTLNVSFTGAKRTSIMSYMENNSRLSDIKAYAGQLTSATEIFLSSDSITVDLDNYKASRKSSFVGY
jgi:hypothetical protein